MKIRLISVGNKMPSWVDAGCQSYLKRFPKLVDFQLIEVAANKKYPAHQAQQIINDESQRLWQHVKPKSHVISLDSRGKQWTTLALAEKFEQWQLLSTPICFLIGGAEGLSAQCKQQSHELWSLSTLTLPHPLARLTMIESLYRAWTVTINHPYHRE